MLLLGLLLLPACNRGDVAPGGRGGDSPSGRETPVAGEAATPGAEDTGAAEQGEAPATEDAKSRGSSTASVPDDPGAVEALESLSAKLKRDDEGFVVEVDFRGTTTTGRPGGCRPNCDDG